MSFFVPVPLVYALITVIVLPEMSSGVSQRCSSVLNSGWVSLAARQALTQALQPMHSVESNSSPTASGGSVRLPRAVTGGDAATPVAAAAAPALFRKWRRSMVYLPLSSDAAAASVAVLPRFLVSIAVAPAAAPAIAASAAAAAKLVLPCCSTIPGYDAGGACAFSVASAWIGLAKPTPASAQPMQGCQQATGQLDSPTSPKPIVGQLASVSGPL